VVARRPLGALPSGHRPVDSIGWPAAKKALKKVSLHGANNFAQSILITSG
jgi:hypothetical protein